MTLGPVRVMGAGVVVILHAEDQEVSSCTFLLHDVTMQ